MKRKIDWPYFFITWFLFILWLFSYTCLIISILAFFSIWSFTHDRILETISYNDQKRIFNHLLGFPFYLMDSIFWCFLSSFYEYGTTVCFFIIFFTIFFFLFFNFVWFEASVFFSYILKFFTTEFTYEDIRAQKYDEYQIESKKEGFSLFKYKLRLCFKIIYYTVLIIFIFNYFFYPDFFRSALFIYWILLFFSEKLYKDWFDD